MMAFKENLEQSRSFFGKSIFIFPLLPSLLQYVVIQTLNKFAEVVLFLWLLLCCVELSYHSGAWASVKVSECLALAQPLGCGVLGGTGMQGQGQSWKGPDCS